MEADFSAILDPFGSNQFMSCPWAMPFFQRLYPAPFPPVSVLSNHKALKKRPMALIYEYTIIFLGTDQSGGKVEVHAHHQRKQVFVVTKLISLYCLLELKNNMNLIY